MEKLTPMMAQYFEIKEKYDNCLLFFRLGDFYELFFDDAIIASEELKITLTGRECGGDKKAPMCGVPYHSVEKYISKLVENGHKVAICDQVENAKDTKTIVKRDVVRVISAGTILDENILDEGKNNYLMAVYFNKDKYGIAVADVTTGEFLTTSFTTKSARLKYEISKFAPKEIIVNTNFPELKEIEQNFDIKAEIYANWAFDEFSAHNKIINHFNVNNVNSFDIADDKLCICATGALLQYLHETQKNSLSHITKLRKYNTEEYMMLDPSSRRNLELCENIKDKGKKFSLLWVLDKTKTAIGARMLRRIIERPLINKNEIEKRLDCVEEYKNDPLTREEIKEILLTIKDIERLTSKVVYNTANGRDLTMLKNSFEYLPQLKKIITFSKCALNKEMYTAFDTLEDIFEKINTTINEESPASIKDGGVIKNGVNPDLDKLRNAKEMGNTWLIEMENREKEKTGIKNLKIKYNKVFGFYLDVTNSYLSLVPDYYVRRQTVANGERYITEELKEIEETILGAEDKIKQLEVKIFEEIRQYIESQIERIQLTTTVIATIDMIQSLAEASEKGNFVKPKITENGAINIKMGRHPVVEQIVKGGFVPNDTYIDNNEDSLSIITGPNMAGKSTYMRQIAIIVLMAQIGCFIPADSGEICIVDRIFTRIGASDDLATGQSTFMVEMSEVASILNSATKNSLLILDEIGRGTSTFDGLSIAWSVLEHIAEVIGAKTFFATHYHELTELEGKISGVKNYCITVMENGDDIIFLRKIERGGADNSYGIQVAKLAGLPNTVISRSKKILKVLNESDITKVNKKEETQTVYYGKKVAEKNKKSGIIIKEIINLDLQSITPREALNTLYELQQKWATIEEDE